MDDSTQDAPTPSATSGAAAASATKPTVLAVRLAAARTAAGVSVEQLAAVTLIDPGVLAAWEAGDPAAHVPVQEIASALGVDPWRKLPGAPRTVESLGPLWARWGTRGQSARAALEAITEWAHADERLSWIYRGVWSGEESPSCFAAHTLPPLAQPEGVTDETSLGSLLGHARILALHARMDWRLTGDIDPWRIADNAGIAAGTAPLGQGVYLASAHVGDGHAIVVNSDVNPAAAAQALLHALLHLALGHVLTASLMPIPDDQDDSIYCCTTNAWPLCSLVEHTVGWLLNPAEATEAQLAQADLGEQGSAPQDSQPTFGVPRPQLHRELGLRHRDLFPGGPSTFTYPANLARRWTAGLAGGRLIHEQVEELARFPWGQPGCPRIDEVEAALHLLRATHAARDADCAREAEALLRAR